MNYLLGSTAVFLCDYAAKEKVEKTYDEKKQKELFHGKVQIEKYYNGTIDRTQPIVIISRRTQ